LTPFYFFLRTRGDHPRGGQNLYSFFYGRPAPPQTCKNAKLIGRGSIVLAVVSQNKNVDNKKVNLKKHENGRKTTVSVLFLYPFLSLVF
jgi:hypothetical protein